LRKRNRIAAWAGSAALVLGPVLGIGMSAAPAGAAACGTGGTTWEAVHLGSPGGQAAIDQVDDWGGANTCLTVPGSTAAYAGEFTVQSQSTAYTGGVLGYPNTSQGCSGGACSSPDTQLPVAISTSPDPYLTDWTYDLTGVASGSRYDTLLDSEFSASCTGSSPTMNASVGIYGDAAPSYTSFGIPHSGTTYTISGHSWYVGHFMSGSKAVSQFVSVTPTTTGMGSMDLGPFYAWVAANEPAAYMPTGDCLQQIATGFEIQELGAGLVQDDTILSGTY
jgi:hypothetical protein